VFVGQTDAFAIGANVFVQDGGTYEVTAKTAVKLTLLNLFASPTNTAPTTAIGSGKLVTVSGEQGPAGEDSVALQIAVTGIGDIVTSGTDQAYIRAPVAFTVSEVRASLFSANSASGPITIDIHKNGVTILSTKLTIDDTETTSLTAAAAAVISDTSIADDDIITIDVDSGTNDGEGLVVTIIGTPV
jgi:hypothetical protein